MPQTQQQQIKGSFDLCKLVYFSDIKLKLDLRSSAAQVLDALCHHYNPNKIDMFPSQEYLAQRLNLSTKSIQRGINELVQKGILIKLVITGKVNHYKFTSKFFSFLNVSDDQGQNESKSKVKMTDKQISLNKYNNSSNFSKNSFYTRSFNEPKYKPADETIKKYKKDKETATNPLEFSKEEQIKYYHAMPDFLKVNSSFAREIKNRWNL